MLIASHQLELQRSKDCQKISGKGFYKLARKHNLVASCEPQPTTAFKCWQKAWTVDKTTTVRVRYAGQGNSKATMQGGP